MGKQLPVVPVPPSSSDGWDDSNSRDSYEHTAHCSTETEKVPERLYTKEPQCPERRQQLESLPESLKRLTRYPQGHYSLLLAAAHLHNKLWTFCESIFIKYFLFCFLTSLPVTLWPLQIFIPCSALELVHVVVPSSLALSTLQSTHYLKNNIRSHKTFTPQFFIQGDQKTMLNCRQQKKWGIY